MSIEVIFGPMFSGKTTELLRRVRRHTFSQKTCLVIKYIKDTRYSQDSCATHDMVMWGAISAAKLYDIPKIQSYDVIGVDEGQFFPDVVQFCEEMANKGKIVIVAALDGTFARKPFGSVLELVPLAESVTKLTAVCHKCHKEAAFTYRIGEEVEIEVIGGAEKYIPVCRTCYQKKN